MRLEQFYEFCKVVETGSLRKASETLFTSPQNVSKSMIQLEQELGVILYDRGPRGVVVTEQGQLVYEHMRDIVSRIEAMRAALAEAQGAASPSDPIMVYGSAALSVYANRATVDAIVQSPRNPIRFSQKSRVALNGIAKEAASVDELPDIILSSDDQEGLAAIRRARSADCHAFRLYEDVVCLQANEDSPFADRESVTWSELVGLPFVTVEEGPEGDGLLQEFERAGFPLDDVTHSEDPELCCRIARDAGIHSFVCYPSVTMRPLEGVCYLPLDPEIRLTGYMLVKKTSLDNPFTRILRDELEKRRELEVLF